MTTSERSPWKTFVRAAKKPVWHAVHRLTGIRMAMPVRYLDMATMGGVFRLAAEEATRLVANELFAPSVADDGLARCHVIALKYRNIDILYPYNELAVTIPGKVKDLDRDTDLFYYLHLPVTSEDARWPGVEIYGFPKYVAGIDFEEGENDVTCSLALEGEEVLALTVSKGPVEHGEYYAENLTVLDGVPLLSSFRGQGQCHTSDQPGGSRLRFGEHPLARELQSAKIELTSCSHFYYPTMQARLSASTRLADVDKQERTSSERL
jgi:hypothetical protein